MYKFQEATCLLSKRCFEEEVTPNKKKRLYSLASSDTFPNAASRFGRVREHFRAVFFWRRTPRASTALQRTIEMEYSPCFVVELEKIAFSKLLSQRVPSLFAMAKPSLFVADRLSHQNGGVYPIGTNHSAGDNSLVTCWIKSCRPLRRGRIHFLDCRMREGILIGDHRR